jgi:bifunctional NMN adenylyltransferase/nudix hydrolase
MKQYNTSVVIGRFQLPHYGHQNLIKKACELADNLVIVVGSVGQPKTPKNPFSFNERKEMLEYLIPKGITAHIVPVQDQRYNTNNWVVDVVNTVTNTFAKGWTDYPPKVVLVGHKKDSSSFYLDMFPQWHFVEHENKDNINATDLREDMFTLRNPAISTKIPSKIGSYVSNWMTTHPKFNDLVDEFRWIKSYKELWHFAPYPVIFNTVDAVVVQSGHILMIQRKDAPGKGLWALPGGFIEPDETIKEAVLRELEEETKIKLQAIILEKAITDQKVYDHPDRSSRGRTITNVFKFELRHGELPRIKGSSDASKAKWIPLNEVFTMGEVIYEDHLDIILDMVR